MEGWCLEGLIAEVIVAEWHCLDADFLCTMCHYFHQIYSNMIILLCPSAVHTVNTPAVHLSASRHLYFLPFMKGLQICALKTAG